MKQNSTLWLAKPDSDGWWWLRNWVYTSYVKTPMTQEEINREIEGSDLCCALVQGVNTDDCTVLLPNFDWTHAIQDIRGEWQKVQLPMD